MHNLTNGEYIQAKKNRDFSDKQQLTNSYMLKTYMKTASLMAIGMRGVAIINNQGKY
jgi:geranylgeranyl pyrophosphate synthase